MAIKKTKDSAAAGQSVESAKGGASRETSKASQGKVTLVRDAVVKTGLFTTIADKIAEFKEFFELSKLEMKKVIWPTRKETMATGIAVLVLVVVMSLYLGIVDISLSKLIALILS